MIRSERIDNLGRAFVQIVYLIRFKIVIFFLAPGLAKQYHRLICVV